MKQQQSLIGNRYLYSPGEPLRESESMRQYKTYDKVTKRELLLQIHVRSDFVIQSLREHKHAFIQFVFDKVELDDGRIGYLFEPGLQATLQQAMRKIGHFSEQDALVLFKYILMGVKQLHDKQLIVERLCLNNILVCNYALLKLGHLTLQNEYPLEYWSPERLQQKQLSFQSDIYSLGVILYKMLYGTFPFTANQPSEMLKKIKSKKFQPPQSDSFLDIVISREVHFLVLSMLDFYEENRPDLNTILANSCFAFDLETDLQKYIKPKGSIVPESFHKKYLIFRPSKIIHKYGDYYSEASYLMFNVQEKTFMTLYAPEVRMFQAEPRKVDSFYQKIRALQKSYKGHGCEYLVRVDDIERFRQEPLIATEYCNQGNLQSYLEKRKVFKGWLNEQQTNIMMYLMAIGLKQMKTLGISSVHTINSQRIMLHEGNIKLREPGILTPIIEKALHANEQIDYFAPELKEKLDFVQLDKSDIWSYGILYIYLLSGEMPKTNEQHQIQLSHLKTSKKNITIIGKSLDYNVKKRIELDHIKIDNINQTLLNQMLLEYPQINPQKQQNPQQQIDPNELLDQSDIDSNAEQIKDNKKVMFKRRKRRLFKHYNKIISESTTTPCRLLIKSLCGLIILWVVFFGIFFINGGIGLLRTNFYRKITLEVPYNYGTTLYNMTILSTNGALISTKYADFSYEQFVNDLRCAQNEYSRDYKGELYDFANNSQSVYCLFGFIWAILLSILHVIQTHKLDLPTIMLKRKRTHSNKQLYHLGLINMMIPALMFTFFYTFAFQYIIQMYPCFGIQNLDYPTFTSVDAVLNGDIGKFFLHVFLTVVLWAILMFVFAFLTLFVKRINFLMYQWLGIVPTLVVMLVFTVICRVGFGTNVPIEPTWTYKINLDIVKNHFGLFGFFPEVLWTGVFLLGVLIDFIFWVFLKIGLTPDDQQDITRVAVVRAKFQKLDTKQKELGNQKSNIYMIENAYDFERFD